MSMAYNVPGNEGTVLFWWRHFTADADGGVEFQHNYSGKSLTCTQLGIIKDATFRIELLVLSLDATNKAAGLN